MLGALLAMLATGAGCTFLIAFDEVPNGSQPRPPAEASVEPVTDSSDAPPSRPPEAGPDTAPPPAVCDESFPKEKIVGCDRFEPYGQICAARMTDYPEDAGDSTKDLVTCGQGNDVTCVRHCVACIQLPDPHPDQCDECAGKNGTYCGKDMPLWENDNLDLLVTCKDGKYADAGNCAKGCDAKGSTGNAACK